MENSEIVETSKLGNRINDRMIPYERLMNRCLDYFAGPLFSQDLADAKKLFFDHAGVIDSNQSPFELRMSQFFEWYFFSRDLNGFKKKPVEVARGVRDLRYSDEELQMLDVFGNSLHSLFIIKKNKNGTLVLRDLFQKPKWFKYKDLEIKNPNYEFSTLDGAIFEARLLLIDGDYAFLKGFCFHPREANSFILKQVKRVKKNPDLKPDELMLNLLKMRYQSDRYRHVDLSQIYTESPFWEVADGKKK